MRTPLCDRFGIETPIFGFSHSVEVVAAVAPLSISIEKSSGRVFRSTPLTALPTAVRRVATRTASWN